MGSLPIVQLRHITTTDAQRQSVTSFALGLDILRKERPLLRLLPQVVTLVKLLCVLPCSTATPERSFSQLRRIKNACNNGSTKTEPFDGDRSSPW